MAVPFWKRSYKSASLCIWGVVVGRLLILCILCGLSVKGFVVKPAFYLLFCSTTLRL